MMRFAVVAVLLLAASVPARGELVVRTRDGRTLSVAVEASEIAAIEFVAGGSSHSPVFQALADGKAVTGEAWAGPGKRWSFELKITRYDPASGSVEGQISWPALASVHRVQGTLSGGSLEFKEVSAIKAGRAHLNVSYVFTLSGSAASGTWIDGGDKSKGEAKFAVP